mgnify:CR=1 FL=1
MFNKLVLISNSRKIKDVMGDDISLCKVTSGGKNIKAALDEEQTVVAVTTD